jgi:hypothetical protein
LFLLCPYTPAVRKGVEALRESSGFVFRLLTETLLGWLSYALAPIDAPPSADELLE